MRDALWCFPFQTCRCAGKQLKVCERVCVCRRMCEWLSAHLYCPLLSCPWSLKCPASSEKNRHIKTESVCKVVRNALWGFGDFCDVQGPAGRKGKRWQERSTVRLQEIKRRRYHSNPLPWLSICHNSLHSSNLQWMQDTVRLFKLWLSTASPNGAESCWFDTLGAKLCNKVKHDCRNSCLLYSFCS